MQLSQNDSRFQEAMNVIRQNGGDAKAAFYNMAMQKGVDPNLVLRQLQGLIG